MTLAYLFSDQFLDPDGSPSRTPLRAEPSRDLSETTADRELVQRIRHGDESAFRDVYVAHVQALWRFAFRFVHAPDVATDVVQDVFASLWTRRSSLEVSGVLRTYLFGAVRHRALAVLRDARVAERASARIRHDLDVGETMALSPDQARQVEQDELTAIVERAIHALPERQKTAVLLRWNDEMNAAEIGRVLGISDTAVRKLLLAARRRIEQDISRAGLTRP